MRHMLVSDRGPNQGKIYKCILKVVIKSSFLGCHLSKFCICVQSRKLFHHCEAPVTLDTNRFTNKLRKNARAQMAHQYNEKLYMGLIIYSYYFRKFWHGCNYFKSIFIYLFIRLHF